MVHEIVNNRNDNQVCTEKYSELIAFCLDNFPTPDRQDPVILEQARRIVHNPKVCKLPAYTEQELTSPLPVVDDSLILLAFTRWLLKHAQIPVADAGQVANFDRFHKAYGQLIISSTEA